MTFLAAAPHLENISFANAGIVALLGYAVVFFGLILLMVVITIMGKIFSAKKAVPAAKTAAPAAAAPAPKKAAAGANAIVAPLPGSVVSISVKAGDAVKSGLQLAVIEAMKMENEILAPADGTVKAVHCSAGQAVQQGDALIELA